MWNFQVKELVEFFYSIIRISRAPRDRAHTTKVKKDAEKQRTAAWRSIRHSHLLSIGEKIMALKDTKIERSYSLAYCKLAKYPISLKKKIFYHIDPRLTKPQNYCQIILLSINYKLLERPSYNRVSVASQVSMPMEQALHCVKARHYLQSPLHYAISKTS